MDSQLLISGMTESVIASVFCEAISALSLLIKLIVIRIFIVQSIQRSKLFEYFLIFKSESQIMDKAYSETLSL